MNKLVTLISIVITPLLYGVYAPIPEQEQGTPLTISLRAGGFYDTNIFGNFTDEIDSGVLSFAPSFKYNASLSEQTFLSSFYNLEILSYDNRPTDDTLFNNVLGINLYHSFAPNINFQIDDTLAIIDNPESLLVGVLQSNQSFNQNLFNVRLNVDFSEKFGGIFKYRNTNFAYDDRDLGELLDRNQHLIGLEGDFNRSPLMSVVGEFRFQDINYDQNGLEKDSDSVFFLTGINYNPDEKLDIRGRIGVEDRDRRTGEDNATFYGEFTTFYRYQEESFLSAGVTYDIRETSDPSTFTDDEVLSVFVNAQHSISGALTASGSVLYNASELLRRGYHDRVQCR